MQRYKRSDILEVERLHKGTSASFIGINTVTGKKGIYKENGCILCVTNDDVREKLASDILEVAGIPCAKIDLVYDDELNQNACFSNYILEENEIMYEPNKAMTLENSNDMVASWVDSYVEDVKQINSDPKFLDECRKNAYNYILMSCVMDSYDLKPDNLPIVLNEKTGKTRICAWFDNGQAFCDSEDSKQMLFRKMSTDEVLESLFGRHYEYVKDLSKKLDDTFSVEKIDEIFSQEYLTETFSKEELQDIKYRFERRIERASLLRQNEDKKREEKNKEGLTVLNNRHRNRILVFLKNIKEKMFSGKKENIEKSNLKNNKTGIGDNLSSFKEECIEMTVEAKDYPIIDNEENKKNMEVNPPQI